MHRASVVITFRSRRQADDWLEVRQGSVPADQQAATPDDLAAMLTQLEFGRSAHTAIQSCPVRKYRVDGAWMAAYTAEIEVHHAAGIDYELEITKDGLLVQGAGPVLTRRPREQDYDVDRIQTVELGWRPVGDFSSAWVDQAGIYYKSGDEAKPPPEIQQVDGILYIAQPVVGVVRTVGTAEYDRWTVEVVHKLGSKWAASLWAVAWWPAGAERTQQQSAECEMKLPQCVVDTFSSCPNPDAWPPDHDLYPRRTAKINACKPEIISITVDQS